mmetsp:Transcript_3119/g.12373  ORF Transcript_3119/g.12373 Transcript_3119/m.12373 type:complete len:242 (-) Transcript_3119:55-780(-)
MASGGSDGAVLLWHRVDDPRVSTAHEWVVVARGAHGAPVTDVCALEMRGGGGTHDSARPSSSSDSSDSSGVYLLATASQDCTVRMWRADLAALAPRHPAPPPTAASSDPAPASDPDHPDPNAFRVVWTTTTTRKATPTSAALAWLPGAGAARVIAATAWFMSSDVRNANMWIGVDRAAPPVKSSACPLAPQMCFSGLSTPGFVMRLPDVSWGGEPRHRTTLRSPSLAPSTPRLHHRTAVRS